MALEGYANHRLTKTPPAILDNPKSTCKIAPGNLGQPGVHSCADLELREQLHIQMCRRRRHAVTSDARAPDARDIPVKLSTVPIAERITCNQLLHRLIGEGVCNKESLDAIGTQSQPKRISHQMSLTSTDTLSGHNLQNFKQWRTESQNTRFNAVTFPQCSGFEITACGPAVTSHAGRQ